MGHRASTKFSAVRSCLFFVVLYLYWSNGVMGQNWQEHESVCDAEGCYSIHLQRKSFRESWRSCKDKGGNLASVKRPEEASLIHELLSSGIRRGSRPKVRLWIGLQRQPRQCSATRPLRGFAWINGDQETQYTNWQRDDNSNACAAHRCVVIVYNTADKSGSDQNNFKWQDGTCAVAVDGFLCHYSYQGMCPALQDEGGGPALYTTPFDLMSTVLTHIPFGSVAILPCPDGEKEDQSVLCTLREDGSFGWSKDTPLCSDIPKDWCEHENGGCEHDCISTETHYYCECSENYELGEDGRSCKLSDPCQSANCEFECESTAQGHRCKCPEGYLLSGDGHSCLDIDECLQKPCHAYRNQVCINAPGTFECKCKEGFSSLIEDPDLCDDIDECKITNICDQVCRNYEGGFECLCEEGYLLQEDRYYCRPIEDNVEHLTVEPADTTINNLGLQTELVTDASPLERFTEMTQEGDVTTQKSDLIEHTTEEDGKLWPNKEEITITNGYTADATTLEYNRPPITSTAVPKDHSTPEASQIPEDTLASGPGTEQHPGDRKKHDKSWLLVALLVPLCVFIVVMLALGIVYCTSCAFEPRNKGMTDCYHWKTTSKPEQPNTAKSRA